MTHAKPQTLRGLPLRWLLHPLATLFDLIEAHAGGQR